MRTIVALLVMLISTVSYAQTQTIYLTDDTQIHSADHLDDFNFGSNEHVSIFYREELFTVSTLIDWNSDDISDDDIEVATLYLYQHELYYYWPPNVMAQIAAITEYWDEGTVTWNTQPDSFMPRSINGPRQGERYSVDITSEIRGEYGIRLDVDAESVPADDWSVARFHSKEYEDEDSRPYIEITYIDETAVYPTSLGGMKALFR